MIYISSCVLNWKQYSTILSHVIRSIAFLLYLHARDSPNVVLNFWVRCKDSLQLITYYTFLVIADPRLNLEEYRITVGYLNEKMMSAWLKVNCFSRFIEQWNWFQTTKIQIRMGRKITLTINWIPFEFRWSYIFCLSLRNNGSLSNKLRKI